MSEIFNRIIPDSDRIFKFRNLYISFSTNYLLPSGLNFAIN